MSVCEPVGNDAGDSTSLLQRIYGVRIDATDKELDPEITTSC